MSTVLIGPSGCGKSTILRLIAGLISADSGTICFDDTVMAAANMLSLRRRIGYVIQDGGLFPHLTAADNITLMARHTGWRDADIADRCRSLAALTHFPEKLFQRYPVELSGGQRQRVSLMRALMLDPEVLLLDEPLGALDPLVRSSLQSELKEIFQALAKTVIMVTHDMAEAAYLGERIVLLRAGKIHQVGPFAELSEQPADDFVREFIDAQRGVARL